MIQLGLNIISETFEDMDEYLRDSGLRRKNWHIVKRDETSLITSLGTVTYHKTLFQNKESKERNYLLDKVMNLTPHTRMTEDAEAKILEEAVESSYRKGGLRVSITDTVSKQTVKSKIHQLKFPEENIEITEKKQKKILYINADEDHVSAQFLFKKGDLLKLPTGGKSNTLIPKLVYLYEDVIAEKEDGSGKRHKLVNPHYFGGLREGKENGALWEEVSDYIQKHYDEETLEKVYLCGDGATWIKSGCSYIDKSVFVLDKYHLMQSIHRSTSHLQEECEELNTHILDCISFEDKVELKRTFQYLVETAESENKAIQIEKNKKYLLNNWKGITIYHDGEEELKGCSAEGHISHVYSSRMSSRPMGWSRVGADKMAMLRVYYYNNGDMLALVRRQKEEVELEKQEEIYSCKDVLKSEKNQHGMVGKYLEAMRGSMNYSQVKKVASMKSHIWGL